MSSDETKKPFARIRETIEGNLAVEESEVASRKREAYTALHTLLRDLFDPNGPSQRIVQEIVHCAKEIDQLGITNEEITAIVHEVREEYGLISDHCREEVEEAFASRIIDLTEQIAPDDGQRKFAFIADGEYADQQLRVKSARHVLAGRIAARVRHQKQEKGLQEQ